MIHYKVVLKIVSEWESASENLQRWSMSGSIISQSREEKNLIELMPIDRKVKVFK